MPDEGKQKRPYILEQLNVNRYGSCGRDFCRHQWQKGCGRGGWESDDEESSKRKSFFSIGILLLEMHPPTLY